MDSRSFFINEHGRLRSPFRLISFICAFIVLYVVLGAGIGALYVVMGPHLSRVPHAIYLQNVVFRLLMLTSAVLAGYLCNRVIEGLPWRALGLGLHKYWFRDLLVGSAIGVVSLTLAVAVATAGKGLRFSLAEKDVVFAVGQTLISSALLFIVAALAEEAIFRGYALQTLCRAQLAWLGIFLTSVPFATVHLWNPNVVPFVTFANTALAGIWLGVAYLRTRSLWFPLGIHWSWNWALGTLFGLPVSGISIVRYPLIRGQDLGPAWLTGGNYGIEGGVACTVALVISTLLVWRIRWVSPDPELLRLTSEENPASHSAVISIRPVEE